MKRMTLALLILLAITNFGGSFSCRSGDGEVHSDPDRPQPNR